MKKWIIGLVFLFLAHRYVNASEPLKTQIKLKSGKILTGEVIEQNKEFTKIDIGVGVPLTYYADEIESQELIGQEVEKVNRNMDKLIKTMLTVSKQYYDTGELKSEGSKMGGIYKTYYKNGQLASEGEFKEGMPYNGSYRAYDESGKIYINQNYKEGRLLDEQGNPFNGLSRILDAKGILLKEAEYKDGKLNGVSKNYSSNGKLAVVDTFVDGVLNGTTKKYDENGNLTAEIYWENGRPAGFKKTEK